MEMRGGVLNSDGVERSCQLTVCQLECLQTVLLNKLELHTTPNAIVQQQEAFEIIPLDFLEELTQILKAKKVGLTSVELAGGAASHVLLATSNSRELAQDDFHDLDVVFEIDIAEGDEYQTFVKIDNAVWECLARFISHNHVKNFPDAFVDTRKLINANTSDGDLWSIISLHNNFGRNFDLKFVHRLEHKYQFSVDSFRIPLTPFAKLRQLGHLSENGRLQMERYKFEFPALVFGQTKEGVNGHIHEVQPPCCVSQQPPHHQNHPQITLPTFYVRSVYPGGVEEALVHLYNKLIWIEDPSVIRGGGLLKYVKLRTQNYVMHRSLEEKIATLEGYMVQRFLCDFGYNKSSLNFQIETYLSSRFVEKLHYKGEYLMELYDVVRRVIPQRDPRGPGYTLKKFLQTQVNLVESKKMEKREARSMCRSESLNASDGLTVLIGG